MRSLRTTLKFELGISHIVEIVQHECFTENLYPHGKSNLSSWESLLCRDKTHMHRRPHKTGGRGYFITYLGTQSVLSHLR